MQRGGKCLYSNTASRSASRPEATKGDQKQPIATPFTCHGPASA